MEIRAQTKKFFKNILFLETDDVEIFVAQGTGKFEISSNDCVIIKGKVSFLEVKEEEELPKEKSRDSLLKNEIYKEFVRRGYNVGSDLKNLESIEAEEEGIIKIF